MSIPACHAEDRDSIPRRGGNFLFLRNKRKRTRKTLTLTLGRTRGGWGMDVLLPPTDKVFFEFLEDDFSSAPVVFGNCMHFP